jgi:hypothetical protein
VRQEGLKKAEFVSQAEKEFEAESKAEKEFEAEADKL